MNAQRLAIPSAVTLLALALSGCGGGSTTSSNANPTSTTIGGTAATGLAIAGGTVSAICANGTSGSATTNADGTYTLSMQDATPPCLLQVDDPASGATLYSAYTSGMTTTNITPLTELVVANALGSNPEAAFANFSSGAAAALTNATLSNAANTVDAALTSLGVNVSGNTLTTPFTAGTETSSGSGLDSQIDTLMTSLDLGNTSGALTQLTTLLESATSTTAASGVAALANQLALPTSSLNSCPYAPSGDYWVAIVGNNQLLRTTVNFGSSSMSSQVAGTTSSVAPMTALDATGVTWTLSQPFPSGSASPHPCEYTMTSTVGTLNVFVSKDSVDIMGATTSTGSSGVALYDARVGIAVPAQPISTAQLLGDWNIVGFGNGNGNSTQITTPWINNFGRIVMSGTATAAHYPCPGGLSCSSTSDDTLTVSQNTDPSKTGLFSITDAQGANIQAAFYRAPSGDLAMIALSAAPTAENQVLVGSIRYSPFTVLSVGSTYAVEDYKIKNAVTSGGTPAYSLIQTSAPITHTVTAVTMNETSPASMSQTYSEFGNNYADQILYNDPFTGMIYRPAVAATATAGATTAWVGLGGLGWTVYGSTATGYTAGASANPYFGMSVNLNY